MANEETANGSATTKSNAPKKRAAPTKAATPWGQATVVEEVKVAQRVGDRRFASLLQLLEDDRGRPLVRISYSTDGVTRRGPVTLRPKDVDDLRAALEPGSGLAAVLGWSGGDA
jgi:hypothetical protein